MTALTLDTLPPLDEMRADLDSLTPDERRRIGYFMFGAAQHNATVHRLLAVALSVILGGRPAPPPPKRSAPVELTALAYHGVPVKVVVRIYDFQEQATEPVKETV